jgi:hypothetical protein
MRHESPSSLLTYTARDAHGTPVLGTVVFHDPWSVAAPALVRFVERHLRATLGRCPPGTVTVTAVTPCVSP